VSHNFLDGRRVGLSTGADERTRDDWPSAIRLAQSFGRDAVELCAVTASRLPGLLACLSADPDALAPFAYVSAHAPTSSTDPWDMLAGRLADLPEAVEAIVVHPDALDARALDVLRGLGPRLCFENMDCAKRGGRFPHELAPAFEACPEAGFCLDVAHVVTHDPTQALAFDLLRAFGDRLRQLHVSGIEPDGTHRDTTAADLAHYAPVLERCDTVPVILETPLAPS
jgi:sugar phosphate isomerase/epimerase